jgi:hypothetical protein
LPQNLAVARYFDTLSKIYPAAPHAATAVPPKSAGISQLRALACQLQSPEGVTQPEHLRMK